MKVLLLDAGGVLLDGAEYFSSHLAKKQNVAEEEILKFFKLEYVDCMRGKADLKKVVASYLEKWKWKGDVDSLLQYWFSYDTVPSEAVIEQIKNLRSRGVKCYMASNNDSYRAEHIKNVLNSRDVLDGYFFSSDLKVRKEEPEFFSKVLAKLTVVAEDVTYFDNDQKNIESARSLGIEGYLFSEEMLSNMAK